MRFDLKPWGAGVIGTGLTLSLAVFTILLVQGNRAVDGSIISKPLYYESELEMTRLDDDVVIVGLNRVERDINSKRKHHGGPPTVRANSNALLAFSEKAIKGRSTFDWNIGDKGGDKKSKKKKPKKNTEEDSESEPTTMPTTQKPTLTTQKPIVTTQKPTTTTQKPTTTTKKPTTKKPTTTTKLTTKKPVTTKKAAAGDKFNFNIKNGRSSSKTGR